MDPGLSSPFGGRLISLNHPPNWRLGHLFRQVRNCIGSERSRWESPAAGSQDCGGRDSLSRAQAQERSGRRTAGHSPHLNPVVPSLPGSRVQRCLGSNLGAKWTVPQHRNFRRREKPTQVVEGKGESGAPGEIRTPDLMLRRHPLYPAELRARSSRILRRERPLRVTRNSTRRAKGILALQFAPGWKTE